MSLINDMLKDLETRKAAAHGPLTLEEPVRPYEDSPAPYPEGIRHADTKTRIETVAQRRLPWLFWPFLLGLILIAGALYVFRSGGLSSERQVERVTTTNAAPAKEPSLQAMVAAPSEPGAETTASSPLREAPPQATPRMVMMAVDGQEGAWRLDLAFDGELPAPLRLTRQGDRVELFIPGVRADIQDAPHPALRDWESAISGPDWRIGFAWPSDHEARLRPLMSDDGLHHWQLALNAPAPAATSPLKTPTAQASRSAAPIGAGVGATDVPPGPAQSRPFPKPRPGMTPAQQAESLYSEAWQLQQTGRAEQARDKLRQALGAQPDHARARELLARLLLREGAAHDAEVEIVRGLTVQPEQPDLVDLYARMLADQGRMDEALVLLRQRMRVDDAGHQALYAVIAARHGDQARAAEAYGRAAALAPEDPRWPLGQAVALENSGQPRAAREAYARALALDGLDAAARGFVRERLTQLDKGER
ncbi:MAG: tetratricopeptide repeat protein [Pseudomonadota bacterium]